MEIISGSGLNVQETDLREIQERFRASSVSAIHMLTEGSEHGRSSPDRSESDSRISTADRVELSEEAREAARSLGSNRDSLRISDALVDQMKSRVGFEASLEAMEARGDMEESVLRIGGST